MSETVFRFKKFEISQDQCAMKINTDGVLLGAWANASQKSRILDIGTGTGVIAIMLAQRSDAKEIVGVEIDALSYEESLQNMKSSAWSQHLFAVHKPIQEYAKTSKKKFDLIVSNPPFFTGGTFSSTQKRTLVKHTIKLPHNELLIAVKLLLELHGEFSLILPYIEGLRFVELAEQYNLYCKKICEVKSFQDSPIERLLLSFQRTKVKVERGTLYIRNRDGSYAEPYKTLTRDFYLKM